MPITESIMDRELFGPAIREGRQQECLYIVRRMLEKRFGPLSFTIEQRLAPLPVDELEDLALRLLDAGSLGELFN